MRIITAADPEGTAAITAYSILNGNTNNAFKIDGSGVIRVSDATKIDFETLAKYTLTIKATEASGGFSSTAAVPTPASAVEGAPLAAAPERKTPAMSVPGKPNDDLALGTWNSIQKQAGLKSDDE